jgi:catecholate siderophore receptor
MTIKARFFPTHNLTIKNSWSLYQKALISMMFGITLPAVSEAAEDAKNQLPTVTVQSQRDNESYKNDYLSSPKFTRPVLDTPQSVTIVTRKVIEDQNAVNVRDSLRNVAGISLGAGEGGFQGDNLTIRGFSARSDFYLDNMRDFGSYNRDTFNIENVEVLKGPSSVMFGRGSTGGVVNQQSKAPSLNSFNQAGLTLGTDLTRRATIDSNIKLGENSAFRINFMGHKNEVAKRDVTENKRFGIAPSLAFGIGTDTRINLSYLHQQENNIPDYGLPWLGNRPADVRRNNYYGFKNGGNFQKFDVDIATAKLEHDINENHTLREQIRYAYYQRNSTMTQPTTTASPSVALDTINITRNQINSKSTEALLDSQTDLISKFKTFGLDNEMVSGVQLSRETSAPTRLNYSGVPTTNLVNPDPEQPFSGTPSPRLSAGAAINSIAFYSMDTLKLSEKWELMGGIRYDKIASTYSQSVAPAQHFSRDDEKFTWRGSVVYKPASNGSLYFHYGTSFNPSAEQLALSAANANVAPEEGEIFEAGTKWNLFKDRLLASAAIFRDQKNNARTPNPNDPSVNVLAGKQRIDGLELQATGNITPKWQVISGYAFMKSEIVKTNIAAELGQRLPNVPEHSFSIWSTYKLPKNIEIGGGASKISSRTSRNAGDRKAPGYTVFNAMAKYSVTKDLALQLNIYNLTDKYYYDQIGGSHVVPGAGRYALLNASLKF